MAIWPYISIIDMDMNEKMSYGITQCADCRYPGVAVSPADRRRQNAKHATIFTTASGSTNMLYSTEREAANEIM